MTLSILVDRSVLQTLVGLMVKLCQLPKMVSRLLLPLRQLLPAGGLSLSWSEEDLAVMSEAITKVAIIIKYKQATFRHQSYEKGFFSLLCSMLGIIS